MTAHSRSRPSPSKKGIRMTERDRKLHEILSHIILDIDHPEEFKDTDEMLECIRNRASTSKEIIEGKIKI